MHPTHGRIPTAAAGVVTAAIFGFSFLFTRMVLAYLSPIDLLAVRFAVAAGAMALLAAARLIPVDLSRRRWPRLLPLAALQPVAYFLCETTGVKLTSASVSGMVIGSIPVFVAFLAAFFLDERPSPIRLLFIICSSLGVAIMGVGEAAGRGNPAGLLCLVGAVLAAGFYNVLSRRLSAYYTPWEMTLVMMGTGAAVFGLLAVLDHWRLGAPPDFALLARPAVWGGLLYLGLLSSVGAFFLVNLMLGRVQAARAAAYTNLTTVIAVLAGLLILGERFRWQQLLAGAMIVLGVWGANRMGRAGPVAIGGD